MWCSGILELITVISLSGTKCFYHFHSEKMFHNHCWACLKRCFIAVNILIANTSCGRSILSCDHYNDKEIKPCWYISNILLGLAHTSELQSEYFPALAVQSVSKYLKVFSGILVTALFSVYVSQRLSVCILIINQIFGLWQKNHIIYMYTLSLQYFLINFILTWNWRWPDTVGEKYPPKRKKNI